MTLSQDSWWAGRQAVIRVVNLSVTWLFGPSVNQSVGNQSNPLEQGTYRATCFDCANAGFCPDCLVISATDMDPPPLLPSLINPVTVIQCSGSAGSIPDDAAEMALSPALPSLVNPVISIIQRAEFAGSILEDDAFTLLVDVLGLL